MPRSIYEAIQPLVAHAEQQGSTMCVVFRCPVSGHEVEAGAALRRGGATDRPGSIARGLSWSLRGGIAGTVRSAFAQAIVDNKHRITQYVRQLDLLGSGAPGSGIATRASASPETHDDQALRYSEHDRREAVECAFHAVADRFLWDAGQGRYVAAPPAVVSGFLRQLHAAPATIRYDRVVAIRMLAEIAAAGGPPGEDARAFVDGFATPDLDTDEEIWAAPRLSGAELARTSEGPVRDTMLMLAWAVAWTDDRPAPEAQTRLGEHATALAVPATRVDELKDHVRAHLFERALACAYAGGRRDPATHAEVMELARRLGVDATSAERADARARERHGLV